MPPRSEQFTGEHAESTALELLREILSYTREAAVIKDVAMERFHENRELILEVKQMLEHHMAEGCKSCMPIIKNEIYRIANEEYEDLNKPNISLLKDWTEWRKDTTAWIKDMSMWRWMVVGGWIVVVGILVWFSTQLSFTGSIGLKGNERNETTTTIAAGEVEKWRR